MSLPPPLNFEESETVLFPTNSSRDLLKRIESSYTCTRTCTCTCTCTCTGCYRTKETEKMARHELKTLDSDQGNTCLYLQKASNNPAFCIKHKQHPDMYTDAYHIHAHRCMFTVLLTRHVHILLRM